MAFTYSWKDGIEFLRSYTRQIPVDKIGVQVCDSVSSEIWNAFPWRDTCTTIPTKILVHLQQEYDVPPLISRLVSAQISRTAPDPTTSFYDPLEVKEALPSTHGQVHPSSIRGIALERGVGLIRLDQQPFINSNEVFELNGVFQMQHTRVASVDSDMWFKDQLYHVAQEGLLYWGYKLADRVQAAKDQYTLFRAKIKEAAMMEDQGASDSIYPAEGSIGSDFQGTL